MIKTTINVMVGNAKQTEFMQRFDMFEPFKRLNQNLCIEYGFEKSEPNLDYLLRLKKGFEDAGYLVTALWFAENPEIHYVDWSVKVVSTGTKWMVLDDYLKQFKITRPIEVEVIKT